MRKHTLTSLFSAFALIGFFASPLRSAPADSATTLFDQSTGSRLIYPYGNGTKLSRGEDQILTLSKDDAAGAWAGIRLSDLPVGGLGGYDLEISYQIKIDSISSIGPEAAHVNASGWFADIAAVTRYSERIQPVNYHSYFEPRGWTPYRVKVRIPENVRYYTLAFSFGHANGSLSLKDIIVRVAPVEVSQRHSQHFTRALLVPRRNSAFAQSSLLQIGQAPLEATAHLTFDDTAFYTETKVHNTFRYQPYSDENIWKADSLQIALDPQLDRSVNAFNPRDDYEFGLADTPDGILLFPYFQPPDHSISLADIAYDVQHDNATETTTYRLDIPWRSITSVAFETLNAFGFNLLINDSNGERRSFIQWTPGIGDRKNPANFGVLFLDKDNTGFAAGIIAENSDIYGQQDYTFSVLGAGYLEAEALITVTLNGQTIYNSNHTFAPGETDISMTVPASRLKDGGNQLTARITPTHGQPTETTATVSHYSEASLLSKISELTETVQAKLTRFKTELDALGNADKRPSELIVVWQVAELFVNRYIGEDIAAQRYTLALRELQDVDRLLDQSLLEIQNGLYRLLPVKSATDIVYDNGTLTSDGSAVFLSGHVYSSRIQHFTDEIKTNLGINYEVISGVTTRYFFTDKPELEIDKDRGIVLDTDTLRRNRNNNIATSILILTYQIPDWFGQLFPDAKLRGNHFLDYDPDHPKVSEFMAKATAHYFELFARRYPKLMDDIVVWDLSNEPTFETISQHTRDNFRAAMQQRYGNIAALNAAWGTEYADFNAIDNFATLLPTHPVCRYDWFTFNNRRFFDFWARTGEIAKASAPEHNIRTTIKVMNGHSWLPKFRINNGYDRFLINQMTDVHGGDTWVSEKPEGPYAFGWREQSMSFDLCKSLAPEQPIIDNEYHATPSTPEHMRASLWIGAWHGLNATNLWTLSRDPSIWFWKTDEGPHWFKYAQDTMPLVMSIYGQESIRINSVMDRIRHFYEAPRPVRILYSQTTQIYDGTESQSILENAYQTLYFQNQSIGFLAENDILAGNIPADLQVLVIPQNIHVPSQLPAAIARLEQQGVRLILLGENSLSRDEADQPIPPVTLNTAQRITDGTLANLTTALPAALLKAGIEAPYFLRTADGSAPDYVEARFATVGGKAIGYAINLGQKAVTFRVVDPQGRSIAVQDIFPRAEPTLNEIRLEPMEPINFDLLSNRK